MADHASADASAAAVGWTCPFCALLCDEFALAGDAASPELRGSTCPRARAALAAHAQRPPGQVPALVDGAESGIDEAVGEAARRLARWRQPLFGGLGTDVAGARALYRLALRAGAICDPADGAALMHGLRALQDRGQYTATLQEVRTRADLVVCVGTPAVTRHPEFFRRIGLYEPRPATPALVFLDAEVPPGLPAHVEAAAVAGADGLFADLQQVAALAGGQHVPDPDAGLAALAQRLLGARYAALVWEPGLLPAQGALLAEMLQRLVATLNRRTRAASLALGGGDGAATVNQVFTWLSGLPLRTRAGAAGLVHEPLRYDAARLLADRAVDGLLWIASFDPTRVPPAAADGLPRIVLGPPAMAARLQAGDALRDTVFVPVATPGLNAPGHLFRSDGIVVVPLVATRDEPLRGVDAVLAALASGLEAAR
jgi:formylmethanofuran dehydrogenase subunit B